MAIFIVCAKISVGTVFIELATSSICKAINLAV